MEPTETRAHILDIDVEAVTTHQPVKELDKIRRRHSRNARNDLRARRRLNTAIKTGIVKLALSPEP